MSHVDLDQVADLDGGVLSPEQERAVRGHLETCDECSQLLERVREVHDLLTAEPTSPIPATVAARIDESLAAAAQDRETHTRIVSLDRARSRRHAWTSRLLAAAVGLVVVGGGAYVAQDILGSNGSSDNATSQDAAEARQNPGAGVAGAEGVPSNLRLQGDALGSELRSAFGSDQLVVGGLKNGHVPTTLDREAPSCVLSALGERTPANWASYRVTFDSRPAVLVLSPRSRARVKVWVVECQPTPIVSASTILSNP